MWIAISNAIGQRVGTGGGPGPGYTPPLDTYTGATAAYSVRKLSSSYSGSCIEAYRVSDGATQDIGFDGDGLIDTAAIATFASGGEARVRTWYDQSGNASDAVQTTASQMPQIYDGASVITQNAKPTIKFILASNTALDMGPLPDFSSNYLGASVSTTTVSNQLCYIYNTNTDYSTHGVSAFHENGKAAISSAVTGSSGGKIAATATTNNQVLHIGQLVSGTLSLFTDGTEETASTSWAPGTGNFIGRRSDGQFDMDGNIQEIVLWNTNESSNRTGIEINLNDYYQIANLPASSSGLLYDYPDAAAAYSVRSLSNNAVKCMRVRRTVSPFDEQDIGFDSNGDLDTSAIATFGGSDSLTVSRWYDQSGNLFDVTQGTATAQPTIFDGTAVITVNGKPAVSFDGNDKLLYTGITNTDLVTADGHASSVVFKDTSTSGFKGVIGTDDRAIDFVTRLGNTDWQYSITTNNTPELQYTASASNYNVQNLSFVNKGAVNAYWRLNASQIASNLGGGVVTPGTTNWEVGESVGLKYQGLLQEVVVWNTDNDSNAAGIESNINTYFSIY